MKRTDMACLIAAALAAPGAALANNECSDGDWNVVFKVANQTEYDFTAQYVADLNVDRYNMPVLKAGTTGWNACFHATAADENAGVSVDYFYDNAQKKFSVTFELRNKDGQYQRNAVADGFDGSPVKVSYNRSKETLTIGDAD